MKILDRFGLKVFSIIIIVISIFIIGLRFSLIELEIFNNVIEYLTQENIINNFVLGFAIFFILLGIKCLIFNSYSKEEMLTNEGILLKNDKGQLLISKEAIINLTNTVIKSYSSISGLKTKILINEEKKIKIFINLQVSPDVTIKDLTANIQNKIKQKIKNSLDLEIEEINIKINSVEKIPEKQAVNIE